MSKKKMDEKCPEYAYDSEKHGENSHCVACHERIVNKDRTRKCDKRGHQYHAECLEGYLMEHDRCLAC